MKQGLTCLVDDEGKEVVAADILATSQVGVAAVHERRGEGVDGKGLRDLRHCGLAESPVLLETHLDHQAVIGQVGDVVTRFPDVHLDLGDQQKQLIVMIILLGN